MSNEVTFETFRQAIVEGGVATPPSDDEDLTELRKRIKAVLATQQGDEGVLGASEAVVERLAKMIWPERSLEIKRKRLELEVSEAAMLQLLKKEIKRAMESANG